MGRDDFTMDAGILDSSKAGRLVYALPATPIKNASVTGGYRVILDRLFTNNSGGGMALGGIIGMLIPLIFLH